MKSILIEGVGRSKREVLIGCFVIQIIELKRHHLDQAVKHQAQVLYFNVHLLQPFAIDRYVAGTYCGSMDDQDSRNLIAAMASAFGDDTRLRLLTTLLSNGSTGLTVTDLSEQLELAQPRISTHLAILRDAGLVESRNSARTRVYRANADLATPVLDALKRAAGLEVTPPASPAARREIARNSAYRNARTCYDHLAGLAGVDLLDGFIFDRWLVRSGGPDERPSFDITDSGRTAFTNLGIDLASLESSRRRTLACGCLDWTERRPHLAGSLGSAIFHTLGQYGFLRRIEGSRQVELLRPIDEWLSHA
jgi:DNA-binding transcriptional ArsR family regulator